MAEILQSIEKGKKTDYVCKAIMAYHNNQLDGNKDYKANLIEVLSALTNSLVEISSNLGNVTLTTGNVGQKPREKLGDKESGNSLDLKGFMLKNIEM